MSTVYFRSARKKEECHVCCFLVYFLLTNQTFVCRVNRVSSSGGNRLIRGNGYDVRLGSSGNVVFVSCSSSDGSFISTNVDVRKAILVAMKTTIKQIYDRPKCT